MGAAQDQGINVNVDQLRQVTAYDFIIRPAGSIMNEAAVVIFFIRSRMPNPVPSLQTPVFDDGIGKADKLLRFVTDIKPVLIAAKPGCFVVQHIHSGEHLLQLC